MSSNHSVIFSEKTWYILNSKNSLISEPLYYIIYQIYNFNLKITIFILDDIRELFVKTYECIKCRMSVNPICRKCGKKLLNDKLEIENGSVQISKCPDRLGKIKSPLCCGQHITCTL